MSQEEVTIRATSLYIDDIYVNESIMSADEVKEKLESFGLSSKDLKCLKAGTLVLGLEVWQGA